jgi:hypothetical protein
MNSAAPKASATDPGRYNLSRIFMLAGLSTWIVAAAQAYRGREPFATWFFLWAWWSYIVFIDGWVYRKRGESLLLSYPGRFLGLALWSAALWLLFEAFNLRLQNWHYLRLPAEAPLRWIGYLLAFATVVPGVLETADLVDSAGLVGEGKVRPLGRKLRVEPAFAAAGAAMLALPLLWPKYFFPLVWGGFVLLLEPLNERWGAPSLLADWRSGRARRFLNLLIAGLLCGGLWEWWNSWSRAQWNYTVPWAGGSKIFEMPVLGYLGFPPFALTVFTLTASALALWQRLPRPARALAAAVCVLFSLGMFWAVDRFTVRSFQS